MKLMIVVEGENILENAKREIITEVVKHCQTQGEACKILGLNPKTLRKYLKEYGLELNSEGKKRKNTPEIKKESLMTKIANYLLKGEKEEDVRSKVKGDTSQLENHRLLMTKYEIVENNIVLCSTIAEKIRDNIPLEENESDFATLLHKNGLMNIDGTLTQLGKDCLYQ